MSAVARTGQAAVLIITALLHAAVADQVDGGGHDSAGHHGVQGQANSGTFHAQTKLKQFKKIYVPIIFF